MSITTEVLSYMEEHANLSLPIPQVATECNITPKQVVSAVNNLRRSGYKIDSPIKGRYVFCGNQNHRANAGRLFELIGESKTGTLVLQDENGELFRAEAL